MSSREEASKLKADVKAIKQWWKSDRWANTR
jgi:hypothetical protein